MLICQNAQWVRGQKNVGNPCTRRMGKKKDWVAT